MVEFDLVIIGSGVGLSILEQALQFNLKCALIENSKFGGTCLTRGCIPSKILVYPADIIRETQHASKIGLDIKIDNIRWDDISKRMWGQINESNNIEKSLSMVDSLTVYKGTAEFTGKYTMRVRQENNKYTEEFKSKMFVIAAGARSFIPKIPGLEEAGFVTSESFFGSKFPVKPWKNLVIIGGGAIGLEFAHIFSAFGTQITIIEIQNHLAPTEDDEIRIQLEKQFRHLSINVLTSTKVLSVEKINNKKVITIQNIKSEKIDKIECEEIFVSSGIIPNSDLLKVKEAGILTDEKGWIITNSYLETNIENIWALGDINGKYQFRHKANYEADILINNLFYGKRKEANYSKVPWAIFTYPQIAHVGLTEKEALSLGIRIKIGKNYYSSVAKGFAMGYSKGDIDDGFIKLIADENNVILGVHIIGPHAAILLQPFVYLMNAGFSLSDKTNFNTTHNNQLDKICPEAGSFTPIYDSMVIHPSLSELAAWVIGKLNWVK